MWLIGAFRERPNIVPSAAALPWADTRPCVVTSQYPWPVGVGAIPVKVVARAGAPPPLPPPPLPGVGVVVGGAVVVGGGLGEPLAVGSQPSPLFISSKISPPA